MKRIVDLIHLVIEKSVLTALASQPLRPACTAQLIQVALFRRRQGLAQMPGASFAKFRFLNHSVYTADYKQKDFFLPIYKLPVIYCNCRRIYSGSLKDYFQVFEIYSGKH